MTDQTTDLREQLLHALDFPYCQTLGYGSPEELLAAYDASRTPAAVPAALREAVAEALSSAERTMLGYALDQAQERIWSEDGFTDEDQAAVDSLRRLTAEQPAAGARQDGAQG